MFGERARKPGEVDRFARATGRVRARIEKQHEFLAGKFRERNGIAAIARQGEGGSLGALGRVLWHFRPAGWFGWVGNREPRWLRGGLRGARLHLAARFVCSAPATF